MKKDKTSRQHDSICSSKISFWSDAKWAGIWGRGNGGYAAWLAAARAGRRTGTASGKNEPLRPPSIVGERDLARFKIDFAPSFPLPSLRACGREKSHPLTPAGCPLGKEGEGHIII